MNIFFKFLTIRLSYVHGSFKNPICLQDCLIFKRDYSNAEYYWSTKQILFTLSYAFMYKKAFFVSFLLSITSCNLRT